MTVEKREEKGEKMTVKRKERQQGRNWREKEDKKWAEWHGRSGLPLKKFFNTSGMLYRELGLKDKLPTMTEEEQFDLLASDGMIVKRPLLVGEDFVLTGFKEKDWEEKVK